MSRQPAPRILISRLSAIGDCILTAPLLCALRERWPGAFIAWVMQPGPAQLLGNHPCLDQVIQVRRGWMKSPPAILALRRQLRALRLDISLDPQSLAKSSLTAWLAGCPRRIGFAPPVAREKSHWLNNQLVIAESTHVVDQQLELLRPLGIEPGQVQFRLPLDREASATIQSWLDERQLTSYAVINPGAGWDSRLWPVERYAQLARRLGSAHQLSSIVVWAGSRERNWAQQIVAAAEGHATLACQTSLRELAAILRPARLFVGSDTGPLHLAAALGVPCVSLHGTTRPQQSGPYGPNHVAVQAYYQQGTSRQRRSAGNDAMRAIPVELVSQACQQILNRPPRDHAA